jgi:hypothetical protein
VAVVTGSIGSAMSVEEIRRAYVRRRLASVYTKSERYWSARARADVGSHFHDEQVEADLRMARRLAVYEQTYPQAAAHPWEPIPPLPPLDDAASIKGC